MLLVAPAAHAESFASYVALGDSYTAAPLVAPADLTAPACLRSQSNYPSLVARALQIADSHDVSCSGATTEHMTASELPGGAPQFSALQQTTQLVTIGIGYNDARLARMTTGCPVAGLIVLGTACRDRYASGGDDVIRTDIENTAPKIARMLREVHERSPQARVLLVGYPQMVPDDGRSCFPILPLGGADNRYFDGLLVALNAMLEREAAAQDAEFVDIYSRSIGHDMCRSPNVKWWEGVIPTSLAFPLHPNARGAQAQAEAVLDALAKPRPAPVLSDLRALRSPIDRGAKARFSYALNRSAAVTFVLARAGRGRRVAGRCRAISASISGHSPCTHWTRPLRTLTGSGEIGQNALALSPRRMSRRGLYRVTATPATTSDGAVSAALSVKIRVR